MAKKDYLEAIKERIEFGKKLHGERYLNFSPSRVIDEVKEELVDIPSWLLSIWKRLEELQNIVKLFEWKKTIKEVPEPGTLVLTVSQDLKKYEFFSYFEQVRHLLMDYWIGLPTKIEYDEEYQT